VYCPCVPALLPILPPLSCQRQIGRTLHREDSQHEEEGEDSEEKQRTDSPSSACRRLRACSSRCSRPRRTTLQGEGASVSFGEQEGI
jgi:hypothetical protein